MNISVVVRMRYSKALLGLSSVIRQISSYQSADAWRIPHGYKTDVTIYNSITRSKVPLILPRQQLLFWYACGPTVYDDSHIGHASSYMKFDIIRRILENVFRINVVQLMGITDIDDKIITRSNEAKTDFRQLAKKYEICFFKDLESLHIKLPTTFMRVSDNVQEIIRFVSIIMAKQLAYVGDDGSVYFDTAKYGTSYARFMPIISTEVGDSSSKRHKRNAADFALWKAAKPEEPFWVSPWGRGRPGWHIECSAMASAFFGDKIDFHSGGIDLMFPHHENELAQSCAYHGVNQWVNYWLHSGHLVIKNEKMSKSLKNFITIQDFLSKHSADDLRIFCLQSHYRNNMDYNENILDEAKAIRKRLASFTSNVKAYLDGLLPSAEVCESDLIQSLETCKENTLMALSNDFDTHRAMENVLNLINKTNMQLMNQHKNSGAVRNPAVIAALGNFVKKFCIDMGLDIQGYNAEAADNKANTEPYSDHLIESIVKFRKDVRSIALQSKNESDASLKKLLTLCDSLRKDFEVIGVTIKDHGKESSWSRIGKTGPS